MLRLDTKMENLPVFVYDTREEMGQAAAKEAAAQIRASIAVKGACNLIFAAAPSQQDFLAALLREDIDWGAVRAFQQDEYIGLNPASPALFGNFLRRHFYDRVSFREVFHMACEAGAVEEKCAEYTGLLKQYPPDLIFLGVGENGHLAFNDPPVADFTDPLTVKVVELDAACRNQQVHDGCFASIEEVPTHAMTLTLSCIMAVPSALAIVPTRNKAEAIRGALRGPLSTACPASILRTHPRAALYLDKDSASLAFDLEKEGTHAVL